MVDPTYEKGEAPRGAQRKMVASQRLWVVELWFENRELFKEIIKHVLLFGVLLSSLAGFHQLLIASKIPDQERELLNKVHFYMYLVVLVIFAGSFIIKVLYLEYTGIRR